MSGFISPMTMIDGGVNIDRSAKIFHFTVIRSNVKIGANTVIGHNVVIERDTVIGEGTTIQSQCHITAEAAIGNKVFFGPGVITTNEKNIANHGRTKPRIEKLEIGNGARIGAGSVLAPGIKIGANSFICAGSFVTKNVPAGEKWANKRGESRASKIGVVPEKEWLV